MNKHIFKILLTTLCIICYQNSSAHGVGGGGSSYTFDQNNENADDEAKTKAAETKKDTENWDDFMSAFKKNKKVKEPEKNQLKR